VKFERGFKAHANQIALEVRKELDIEPHAPLCPWSLARHLAIAVLPLNKLADVNPSLMGHVDYLSHAGSKVFSAVTVFCGCKRLIVHNDSHALTRQRSDLAHELGHALLMHPPHLPFCSSGKRVFDSKLENEAGWLGPVLLVPNEAAHWAVFTGFAEEAAAQHYGVSLSLLRFRFRMSGAHRIRNKFKEVE
jgi:hypothetical protein